MNDDYAFDFTAVEAYEEILDAAADTLRAEPAFTVYDTQMQSADDGHPFPDALSDAEEFRNAYDILWKYQYDTPDAALHRFARHVSDTDTPTVGTIELTDPVPRTIYDRDNPEDRDSTGESLDIALRITDDLDPYLAIDEGILNPEKSGVKAYIEHVTDVLYGAGFTVEDRYTGDIMEQPSTPAPDTVGATNQPIATDDD